MIGKSQNQGDQFIISGDIKKKTHAWMFTIQNVSGNIQEGFCVSYF
jgi:hypothetical protein